MAAANAASQPNYKRTPTSSRLRGTMVWQDKIAFTLFAGELYHEKEGIQKLLCYDPSRDKKPCKAGLLAREGYLSVADHG